MKHLLIALSAIVFGATSMSSNYIYALSPEQKKLYEQNILYYDLGCSEVTSSTATGNIGSVFIVGDSILSTSDQSQGDLNIKNKLQGKDIDSEIKWSGGASINRHPGTNGEKLNGVNMVEKYKNEVSNVDAVVVALGTNNTPDTMEQDVKKMVAKIKEHNDEATILWVNTYTKSPGNAAASESAARQKNQILDRLSEGQGYSVIDVTSANIKLHNSAGDVGIHPEYGDPKGIGRWVDAVVEGISSASGPADPDGKSIDIKISGSFKSGKPLPSTNIKKGDAWKGTASTYGNDPKKDYVDPGDNNRPALSGASNDDPGIAVYNNGSLGGWWKVIDPKGKGAIVQQTDIGPSTSHMVDINAVAARSIWGYPPGNAFPTGEGKWKIEYLGKSKPEGAITKDSGGKGDAVPDDGSGTETSDDSAASCACGGEAGTNLAGNGNGEKVFNYFIDQGFTNVQAAGITGNLEQESGFDPTIFGGGGGVYFGIAQWSPSRRIGLESLAREQGKPREDLGVQLDYIMKELESGYKSVALDPIKASSNLEEIVFIFVRHYEIAIDSSQPRGVQHYDKRLAFSQKWLDQAGGSTGGGGSGGSSCPESSAPASCSKLEGTPKDIIDKVVLPMAKEIGFDDTPESVEAANAAHGPTINGGRSDHQGPPDQAWAADISNGTNPTPEMDELAKALAKCFELPAEHWEGNLNDGRDNQCNSVTSKDGYRIQLIYRTNCSGNHYNHNHIGIKKE